MEIIGFLVVVAAGIILLNAAWGWFVLSAGFAGDTKQGVIGALVFLILAGLLFWYAYNHSPFTVIVNSH